MPSVQLLPLLDFYRHAAPSGDLPAEICCDPASALARLCEIDAPRLLRVAQF
jgi:hypothetical protein